MRLLKLFALAALCALGCSKKSSSPAAGDDGGAVGPQATVHRAVGAACAVADAATCSDDGTAALRCEGGKLAVISACRGDGGCAENADSHRVRCDDSIAIDGDPCVTPGQPACSADGKSELFCRDGGFTKTRECLRPCALVDDGGGVRCD